VKKRIKIHGFLIFLGAILIIIFPKAFLRLERSGYDLSMFICGLVFLFSGFYLRICARGYKAEHSDKSKKLVTGGPYSLTRNPMYLGIFLIAIAIILLGFKIWVLAAFLIFFIACYVRLMSEEENKLTRDFGQEYINYKNKTPLFLPKLSNLFKKEALKKLSVKPGWIKKEISALAPVLLVATAFNLWKLFVSS